MSLRSYKHPSTSGGPYTQRIGYDASNYVDNKSPSHIDSSAVERKAVPPPPAVDQHNGLFVGEQRNGGLAATEQQRKEISAGERNGTVVVIGDQLNGSVDSGRPMTSRHIYRASPNISRTLSQEANTLENGYMKAITDPRRPSTLLDNTAERTAYVRSGDGMAAFVVTSRSMNIPQHHRHHHHQHHHHHHHSRHHSTDARHNSRKTANAASSSADDDLSPPEYIATRGGPAATRQLSTDVSNSGASVSDGGVTSPTSGTSVDPTVTPQSSETSHANSSSAITMSSSVDISGMMMMTSPRPSSSSVDAGGWITSPRLSSSSSSRSLAGGGGGGTAGKGSSDVLLAREHFPVTFGANRLPSFPCSPNPILGEADLDLTGSISLQQSGVFEVPGPPLVVGGLVRTLGGGGNNVQPPRRQSKRPGSGHSSSSSNSQRSSNKMYLMTLTSPSLKNGGSTALLSSTPYQAQLEQLRMDRLRLEEERLVHQKKQLEAERARPPIERWYELKSPQFHYEFRKHNDRLKSSGDITSIVGNIASS